MTQCSTKRIGLLKHRKVWIGTKYFDVLQNNTTNINSQAKMSSLSIKCTGGSRININDYGQSVEPLILNEVKTVINELNKVAGKN